MVAERVRASAVVAVGECMLELRAEGQHWQLGHGGDTFNTALYLARLGEDVGFFTALGDDTFSSRLRRDWEAEGLRTEYVLIAPSRLPGLYAIVTDGAGERDFHYWRSDAPVRDLFRLRGCTEALARSATAELLYVSGITLALFDRDGRAALERLARRVRENGGVVAFDPNYRMSLWQSARCAREAFAEFASVTTILLPTFADEAALHGDADPAATQARWHEAGVGEIVIKLGADGCMIDDGRIVAPARDLEAIDTTGAGDAFNAGYLAARRRGVPSDKAGAFGNHLAGIVIGHRGAILPLADMPSFEQILAATSGAT